MKTASYQARFGPLSWSGPIDHIAPAGGEAPYHVPEIYLGGDITSIKNLDGRLYLYDHGGDCSALRTRIYMKATIPGTDLFALGPWTEVGASLVDSTPAKCVYSYSIPTDSIREMFAATDSRVPGSENLHYLAVVMKSSESCRA